MPGADPARFLLPWARHANAVFRVHDLAFRAAFPKRAGLPRQSDAAQGFVIARRLDLFGFTVKTGA